MKLKNKKHLSIKIDGESTKESTKEKYQRYFTKVRYRGQAFVEMKRMASLQLIELGFTNEEVASILGLRNHTTISHYKNNYSPSAWHEVVVENWDKWVDENVYPKSITLTSVKLKEDFRIDDGGAKPLRIKLIKIE